LRANKQRIQEQIESIGHYTATPGEGTTRLSYSAEDTLARAYIKQQMMRYGLTVREDAVGNIYGRLEGTLLGAPAVIVGSHFDSVPNGGSFDGPAGVVTGLEVAALFQEQQLVPTYPLEVIAMVEEEGSRFGGGLLGSRMIAGQVDAEELAELKDGNGISAKDAMAKLGFRADQVADALRTAKDTKAFIELHIEQGPVLENAGDDVAIVDMIVGMTEIRVTIEGKAGHAGTTPMVGRSDALAAAVTVIHQLPALALNERDDTVLTVGKLTVHPNGANVIPNKVIFTVDIRSKNNETIKRILKEVHNLMDGVSKDGITCSSEDLLYMQPVHLSSPIHDLLVENCMNLNLKYRDMVSGAGHDAMIFAAFTDVGLVFVPSKDGISHTPSEWTDYEQLRKGIEVVFQTIVQLTEATCR